MLSLFDMTVADIFSGNSFTCQFAGTNCYISDFKEVISPLGSTCISFNAYNKSSHVKKVKTKSNNKALILQVDIRSKMTLLDVLSKQNLFVLVHPYGTLIDQSKIIDGHMLNPGTYNLLHVEQSKVCRSFIITPPNTQLPII